MLLIVAVAISNKPFETATDAETTCEVLRVTKCAKASRHGRSGQSNPWLLVARRIVGPGHLRHHIKHHKACKELYGMVAPESEPAEHVKQIGVRVH